MNSSFDAEIMKRANVGDLFNSQARKVGDIFEIPYIEEMTGLRFKVCAGMGMRDLCCLNHHELIDGMRYRFEIVDLNKERRTAFCRALKATHREDLDFYQAEQEELRKTNEYIRGRDYTLIPAKSQANTDFPFLLVYDSHYPNVTGIINFRSPQRVGLHVGRRVLARLTKITKREERITTKFFFNRRLEDRWLDYE